MFDRKPDNYDDAKAWFLYFRMTKYLPAMPKKFEEQLAKAPDAKAARTVMTGFGAAALDIALFCKFDEGEKLTRELEMFCGMKPKHLLLLSVTDLAAPLKVTADELKDKLTAAGFSVDARNIVTGFKPPTTPAAAHGPLPRIRNPFEP